jgi:hypothetical protein
MSQPTENPFRYTKNILGRDRQLEAVDAKSRVTMLQGFGPDQLRAVVAMPDVQKSVRTAAERRLRKLGELT